MVILEFLKSKCTTMSQRWIVCALCSYALALFSMKKRFIRENFDAIRFLAHEIPFEEVSIKCPFFFSRCPFKKAPKGLLPFPEPELYHLDDFQDMADQMYFAGKAMGALPAGKAADLGWNRELLAISVFIYIISSLMMPMTSELGTSWFLFMNMAEGAADGMLYPNMISLVSRWAPLEERNTFTVFILTGKYYGDALGHIMFALVWTQTLSWNCAAYSIGTLALLWVPLWLMFGYNTPFNSPFTTVDECYYITPTQRHSQQVYKLSLSPWKKIFTSRPYLSFILAFAAWDWTKFLLVDGNLDGYVRYILHYSSQVLARMSVMTVAGMPLSLIGGLLADWMEEHKLASKTLVKRVYIVISVMGPCAIFMVLPLSGCEMIVFATMHTTALFLLGLVDSAIFTCPVDLSPSNAGLLMGVIVLIRTFQSLFAFKIEDKVKTDIEDIDQWLLKLWWCIVLAFFLMLPFMIFGSGEKQQWSEPSSISLSLPPASSPMKDGQNGKNSEELAPDLPDQEQSKAPKRSIFSRL